MKDIIIEARNLSKYFFSSSENKTKTFALKEVNLRVCRGEIYGIVGSSGAGKSTLIRCLNGLETPTTGAVLLSGKDINGKTASETYALKKEMGMVFQHFQLFSSRTVAENIAYPMEIHGTQKKEREQRIDELLSLTSLTEKKHNYPSQLSGGEKQRVGIARALANRPQILFCDEPTSALDQHNTQSFLNLLIELNRGMGLTIVVITHQLEIVRQICSHVAVLSRGEIVEEGPVKEVFTRPTHPATRRLLRLNYDQIPKDLLFEPCETKRLIRLSFEGERAREPIVSRLVKNYGVEANILSGNLDYFQEAVTGTLLLELSGSLSEIQESLNFLQDERVHCEVII
jgi:D-methionine transport system ATP-binding protein